jgi:hypothetical protein
LHNEDFLTVVFVGFVLTVFKWNTLRLRPADSGSIVVSAFLLAAFWTFLMKLLLWRTHSLFLVAASTTFICVNTLMAAAAKRRRFLGQG